MIMKTPRSLDLEITGKCNLRCRYCSRFSSAEEESEADLGTADWISFFEELKSLSILSVCLSGGEPFLRPDLTDLIRSIVDNRMRFSILTNGSLITRPIARFLASTGRLDIIQVSIDGADPFDHESFRGEGSFHAAIGGLRILMEYSLPVTARVTIHKNNFSRLEEIADFLLNDIGLPEFSTNSAAYLGRCRENAEEIQLSAAQRMAAMKTLLRISKLYPGRVQAQAGPLAEARQWYKMEMLRRNSLKEGGMLLGCGGIMEKLAVGNDGVVIPCAQMRHYELGRVNKDSLADLWLNSVPLNRLRNRRNISLKEFAYCADCVYVDQCTGNCPASAYSITKDALRPSPEGCLKRFLEDGGSMSDIEEIIEREFQHQG